jgi:hypothetical protein
MTAHAAQGKTRPFNVVHLNACWNHLSYYTALSRSATARGTIIIQGFDPKIITKGCSGYLRQELRELEILNDITKFEYDKQLPEHINGLLRNNRVRQYQQWKGTDYIPEKVDQCLKWSFTNPLPLLPAVADIPWISDNTIQDQTIVSKEIKISTEPSTYNMNKLIISTNNKHLLDEDENVSNKKAKVSSTTIMSNDTSITPTGLQWDKDNWSCAYDSLFVILYDIWKQDSQLWTNRFKAIGNNHLNILIEGFYYFLHNNATLEQVRDDLRYRLHMKDPITFPVGQVGTSIAALVREMFNIQYTIGSTCVHCPKCQYKEPPVDNKHLDYVLCADSNISGTTSQWLKNLQRNIPNVCPQCLTRMTESLSYKQPPKFLVMEYPDQDINSSHIIIYNTNGQIGTLRLRGIIYHGSYHFVSRIISNEGKVWYHDGITTGSRCTSEGNISSISDQKLKDCKKKKLVLAIYAQD